MFTTAHRIRNVLRNGVQRIKNALFVRTENKDVNLMVQHNGDNDPVQFSSD